MNCGSVLRPITPAPDLADPDFEFYREKMDRGCQAARTTRVVVTVLVAGLAMVGLRLWRRRGGVNA